MLALLLILTAAAPAPTADPIATAIKGLNAVIEDDMQPGPDVRLRSMQTKGCTTRVTGAGRAWTIDWRKAEAVALEDTFVFVLAPPIKFAIVGDASKPDQAAKLRALAIAMQGVAARCKVG